jgi:hypothetical protein
MPCFIVVSGDSRTTARRPLTRSCWLLRALDLANRSVGPVEWSGMYELVLYRTFLKATLPYHKSKIKTIQPF